MRGKYHDHWSRKDAISYHVSRWVKFEETVERAKDRWSKPHIPLLTLQSIFQLKNCLKRGLVLLDLDVPSFPFLVGK